LNLLEQKLQYYAGQQGEKIALQSDLTPLDQEGGLTYHDFYHVITLMQKELQQLTHDIIQPVVAVLMDNQPAWAVIDLALLFNQQCSVPLPKFFSTEQLLHTLENSEADYLISDDMSLAERLNTHIVDQQVIHIMDRTFICYRLSTQKSAQKKSDAKSSTDGIVKITYTSGTTGQPKGVMLSEATLMAKVESLADASEANKDDIALSILPLSTLLENIGGLYVPLYCGATVSLVSPQSTGLSGSSQIHVAQLLQTITQYQPTAFIIIPQLLLLFIKAYQEGYKLPDSLRFIAMGGAPVSRHLLILAKQLAIPVFEGYGLSEAASVVAVNNPSAHRIGSVGKVLMNHHLAIVSDKSECNEDDTEQEGEIIIKNALFNGYLGQANYDPDTFYATGDIGYLDNDGFLFITGRKKNIINTSFGRNISPEWLEKELEAIAEIAQCVVYGHAKPYLVALLVLRNSKATMVDKNKVEKAITQLNNQLPDYARIINYAILNEPFSVKNKQLTGTGRPRRSAIYEYYSAELEQCYETTASI